MHHTSLKKFLSPGIASRATLDDHNRKTYSPYLLRSIYLAIVLATFFLILSGCKTMDQQSATPSIKQQNKMLEQRLAEYIAREEALVDRENKISSREKELVDLYAELVKEKKALTAKKASQIASMKSTAAQQKIQQTATKSRINRDPINGRIILGEIEKVFLDPPGLEFSARIDTGAKTSSLNAVDLVEFERDGNPYVKFNVIHPETGEKIELIRRVRGQVRIKDHQNESRRRPIVSLRVKIANIDERISFTLVDRSKFSQQVLLGRNFLRDLAIVDVSKKFSVPSIGPKESDSK